MECGHTPVSDHAHSMDCARVRALNIVCKCLQNSDFDVDLAILYKDLAGI
jgi:hypothetical protein